jgi:hypothetical protein
MLRGQNGEARWACGGSNRSDDEALFVRAMLVEECLGSAGRQPEIGDFGGTGYATRSSVVDRCVWFLKAVLDEQMQIVPLIEDLALDVGVKLSQFANLPVLLGDELLAHRGYLYVDIVLWEVEVRAEML